MDDHLAEPEILEEIAGLVLLICAPGRAKSCVAFRLSRRVLAMPRFFGRVSGAFRAPGASPSGLSGQSRPNRAASASGSPSSSRVFCRASRAGRELDARGGVFELFRRRGRSGRHWPCRPRERPRTRAFSTHAPSARVSTPSSASREAFGVSRSWSSTPSARRARTSSPTRSRRTRRSGRGRARRAPSG